MELFHLMWDLFKELLSLATKVIFIILVVKLILL